MLTKKIQISTDKARLNIDFIHTELAKKYWSVGIPRSIVETAIANSMCFGVYLKEDRQQIGFARVITDFATFAYLADVFILDQYQGQGFARQLLTEIQSHPNLQGLRRWMLITSDAHELYKQFGFTALAHPERLMEISLPLSIYQTP